MRCDLARLVSSSAFLVFVSSAVALIAPSSQAAIIADGGFEVPSLPYDSYVYAPTGSPWTFLPSLPNSSPAGKSGIINNSPLWPVPPAVDGVQVGFIQSALGLVGSFEQTITFDHTGPYQLQYYVAGRLGPSGEGGNLPFTVFYNGSPIATDASTTAQPFTLRDFNFTASAGSGELLFQGYAPVPDNNEFHDNTAFFDAISITPLPEPATTAFLSVIGLGGMFVRRRRN
jgi:hypothetical protein